MTVEAPGHHLGSSPSIPWESLRPVRVPSIAVDLIFLIPGQAQWKWILGTSDWRVNTSLLLEDFGVCGLLQGQALRGIFAVTVFDLLVFVVIIIGVRVSPTLDLVHCVFRVRGTGYKAG